MVWRLVLNGLWRSRWVYVFAALGLTPIWLIYSSLASAFGELSMLVVSLMAAVGTGPMLVMGIMSARELRHLPVTAHDVRTATWLLATVVPSVLLGASKALPVLVIAILGGTPKLSPESIALSVLFDLTWTGCVLHLWLRSDAWLYTAADRGRLWWIAALATFGAALLGGLGLPFLVGPVLPLTFDGFTPAVFCGVVGAALLSISTLFWTPSSGLFAGDRARIWWRAARGTAASGPRRIDRITGMWRIVVPYLALMLTLPMVVWLVAAVYGWGAGKAPLWFAPPDGSVIDPAKGEARFVVVLPTMMCLYLAPWTVWTRQLKVLPLSVRLITAVLVLTPFAATMLVMGAFWTLCALAYRTGPTIRLDLVLGVSGVAALAHACLVRFQGSLGTIVVVGAGTVFFRNILEAGLADSTHIVFGAAGALAALMAAAINTSTLTHSTSKSTPFQRPQPPFGQATSGLR